MIKIYTKVISLMLLGFSSVAVASGTITKMFIPGTPLAGESVSGQLGGVNFVLSDGQKYVTTDQTLYATLPGLKIANADLNVTGEFVLVTSNVTVPTAVSSLVFYGDGGKGIASVGFPNDSTGIAITRPSHGAMAAASMRDSAPVIYHTITFTVYGQDGTYYATLVLAEGMNFK